MPEELSAMPLTIIIKFTSNALALISSVQISKRSFVFSIYDMLSDIAGGAVFAFLGMSAPYLGVSLYNLEHVKVLTLSMENCVD